MRQRLQCFSKESKLLIILILTVNITLLRLLLNTAGNPFPAEFIVYTILQALR